MPAEFYARKTLANHETPVQQQPSEYQEMHNRRYFECQPLRCLISVEACGDNHTRGRCLPCLECAVGRKHATDQPSQYKAASDCDGDSRSLRASMSRSCIRCGDRHVSRLMAESFCPKCWNRCLELVSGRNSKGHWPKEAAKKLRRIEALIVADADLLTKFLDGKFSSTKVLRWTRIDVGAVLLEGIAASRQELEKMLARVLPDSEVADYTERAIAPSAG